MSSRWQPALLDPRKEGGWAVVHCQQGFLSDANGVLFPRGWVKRLELPLISEQGLKHALEVECRVVGGVHGWRPCLMGKC
jgi:hypothetical protein